MPTGTFSSATPEWTRWLNVLSDLNYDPATGIAPHKPLLLLVVCDLAEAGKLDGALLRRDGDLVFRFLLEDRCRPQTYKARHQAPVLSLADGRSMETA